jgi:amino acid transporter
MAELKRHLGMWGAASIGIGAIIGAGIFVLSGVASGLAGPAVIFSFLIAGIVALLTALSSAELSSFITDAGGPIFILTKHSGNSGDSLWAGCSLLTISYFSVPLLLSVLQLFLLPRHFLLIC